MRNLKRTKWNRTRNEKLACGNEYILSVDVCLVCCDICRLINYFMIQLLHDRTSARKRAGNREKCLKLKALQCGKKCRDTRLCIIWITCHTCNIYDYEKHTDTHRHFQIWKRFPGNRKGNVEVARAEKKGRIERYECHSLCVCYICYSLRLWTW